MGKTSRGVLGLLFASWAPVMALANGAPTLTVVTDVWPPFRMITQNDEFHGLDIDILRQLQARSGIAMTLKRVPWGRALKQMQTGQADLMIGLAHTEARATFIDYLQPAYYQCQPAFYGKAAAVATLNTYGDLRGREIGYVLNSAYFSPFDGDTGLKKHGVPTEDQLQRMVERGHLPLMIGTDCQVDYALSQHNAGELVKAAYRPPHPVVLYLGMSKRSPHHALGPRLAQALQAMVESGEIGALAKPYQP
ncbi:substrate-binding periplasmic protein [Aeromonas sp. SrichE-2G]|uniref:substrate-binding periplasmic protein n=1 Tax=Aeromonas TaxID=642 RepID=UPI001B33803C|nr:transporter substrate-binding domain-containing protein [Aeromonas sp. SrichE-2G]MBP4043316.1 transporter substrate-binding domain-containing protein [Aeromonas sp. SrichE-2G]